MHAQQQEKIGHLMIWLSQKVPDLYITKLLKLLYICDETAVVNTGVPITWLNYKVWKYGPVPLLVYDDLAFKESFVFGDYVSTSIEKVEWKGQLKTQLKIEAKKELNKQVFSLQEVRIIEDVIRNYGSKSAKELVDILHQKDTLWHKIYMEESLSEVFDLPESHTSPYDIELSVLLTGDEQKLAAYKAMEEFQAFSEAFNR